MVFGRLIIIDISINKETNKRDLKKCICKCVCGNIKTVHFGNLKSGNTLSCGCFQKENTSKIHTKHGLSNDPTYTSWRGMVERCNNPKNSKYSYYGGKGIKIDSRWLIFKNFYEDMGIRPSKNHTIDRIDCNKDYYKENCRWATRKEQTENRSSTYRIKYKNKTKTLSEWADILKIKYGTLRDRIEKLKWSIEEAFNKPINNPYKGKIKK